MAVGRKGKKQFQDLFDEVIPFTATVTLTATAGSETQAAVTVAGAAVGDAVVWGLEEDMEAGVIAANVNAANTVEFTLVNATASTITIASATVNGAVLKWNPALGNADF